MRIVGQREAGGLGLTDLLVVDAASSGLTGDSQTIGVSLIQVVTILLWSLIVDALAYRFPRFSRCAKARPRVLVDDGELNRKALLRELMTREELFSQLRLHGIDDPGTVHRAYLEPGGMVSVLPRPEAEEDVVDGATRPPSM